MLKAIRNLDYAVIICRNVEPMRTFYRDIMEFPIYRDFGSWVEFRTGSVLLTLRERGTGYEGIREHDGMVPEGVAGVQLAFRVSPQEVNACLAELQDKGVEILQEPNIQDTGHRTLFFKDPESNIIEIYAEV